MNDQKLNSLFKSLQSSDKGVALNHIRLMALESVLATNFPKVYDQYQNELYQLVQSYEKQHPGFLPPPNVKK